MLGPGGKPHTRRGFDDRRVVRGSGPATRLMSCGNTVIDGIATTTFDMHDHASTVAACAGADVVVMAAQPGCPDWVAQFPNIIDNVLAGVETADAKLVFVDNLYMYAPAAGVLTEDSPEHATDPKGSLRRQLGDTLMAAHRAGRARVTIGRFSDYYGPGGTNSGLYMMGIRAALDGRRPRGVWDIDQLHTFHHLPDAARGFATLVEDERADGQVWILPAAPALTQRELLGMVSAATGTKSPGVLPHALIWVAGLFDAKIRESRSVRIQYDRPWVVDASAFEATFGPIQLTPHEDAVRTTIAWFRANPDGTMSDPATPATS